MMPFVCALPAVLLGQLDAVPLKSIDGPDVNAVGSDDFHMFSNSACYRHVCLLQIYSTRLGRRHFAGEVAWNRNGLYARSPCHRVQCVTVAQVSIESKGSCRQMALA